MPWASADDASTAARNPANTSACSASSPCEIPNRLRVCHSSSASQSNPSAAISPLRSTRPAAVYRSSSRGIGALRNAEGSTSSASWIGPSPDANRNPSGIGTASNERWMSSSRIARSKPVRTAATWAAVAAGGPSSGDQRSAPPTTSTRAQPPTNPSSQPSGPSTTSVSRPSSIQPSVSSTPSRSPFAVDELDVVVDQPPAQRREVRVHPHEPLRPIAGVDPHRPRRPLHQGRHEHEPGGHLGERGIPLQQPIEVVAPDRTIPRRAQPRPQLAQRQHVLAEGRDDGVAKRVLRLPSHGPDDARTVPSSGTLRLILDAALIDGVTGTSGRRDLGGRSPPPGRRGGSRPIARRPRKGRRPTP